MRVFKSYTEAMTAVLPNEETLRRIGKEGSEYFKDKLLNNRASGLELADRTIQNKIYRGAGVLNAITKLLEGGGLAEQLGHKVTGNTLSVGWFNEDHRKFLPKDNTISVSKLAAIHHNGKGVPERKVLTDGNDRIEEEFVDIVANEIEKRILGL